MPDYTTQKYTVAFIFNKDLSKVLLIHKQKPDWQKGFINGVGGKYEEGETPGQCVARETKEETLLEIPEKNWVYAGVIEQPQGNVGILTAQYSGPESDASQGDHEKIEWFTIDPLPKNVMPNLRFLIPVCLEKLTNDTLTSVTITYDQ